MSEDIRKVTQADRDAAKEIMRAEGKSPFDQVAVMMGRADRYPLVQGLTGHRQAALEEAAKVAESFPDKTEEPYTIPARPPADEDDLGTPEGHGSIIRFTKPAVIAAAIRSLIGDQP